MKIKHNDSQTYVRIVSETAFLMSKLDNNRNREKNMIMLCFLNLLRNLPKFQKLHKLGHENISNNCSCCSCMMLMLLIKISESAQKNKK